MIHSSFLRPVSALALAFLCAAPRPQEDEGGPTVLSLSEIVLDQYLVKNVDAGELYELAQGMIDRTYFVKERGVTRGDGVSSLRLLGDAVILYDTPEQVKRAKDLLARLDVSQAETPDEKWKIVEYRPRFVSLDTILAALSPFTDDGMSVAVVQERGLVVLQEDADEVEQALALLQRIDVAEKQVLLTCELVEVGGASQGPALPKELVDNLAKLLPGNQFSLAGLAMLQTSVSGQQQISMRIETGRGGYELGFVPVAYDEATSSLTVTNCALTEDMPAGQARELFRTNTIVRGGEYTVLAATGATPRLLVVRVTPMGR